MALPGNIGSHGLIGGAWQKNPLLLGYSGDQSELVFDNNATAGTNSLNGTVVPAGEIWVVQAIQARDKDNAIDVIKLIASVNGVDVIVAQLVNPAADLSCFYAGALVLSEGDKVWTQLKGCTLNDDIELKYHAYTVDIDQ